MQERPANYCQVEECAGNPECEAYEPPVGKTQKYPDDESFKVAVDLSARYLDAIPVNIDPLNPFFGETAAVQGMTDETLDGFAIIAGCLPTAGCSQFDDPCPLSVPGFLVFEALHLGFRTAMQFKVSSRISPQFPAPAWSEVPSCVLAGEA